MEGQATDGGGAGGSSRREVSSGDTQRERQALGPGALPHGMRAEGRRPKPGERSANCTLETFLPKWFLV